MKYTESALTILKPMLALALVIGLGLGSRTYGQAFYKHVFNVSGGVGIGGLYKINETKIDSTNGSNQTLSRSVAMNSLKFTDGNAWGLSFEYGYREWKKKGGLGIGAYLGTRKFIYRDYDLGSIFSEKSIRFYILTLETRYHIYTRSRWDPYFSTSAGIQLKNSKFLYTTGVGGLDKDFNYMPDNKPIVAYSAAAGMRYFFANNMAAYAEAGFGYYYAKFGLNLIIKK